MGGCRHDTRNALVRDRSQVTHSQIVELQEIMQLVQLHSSLDGNSPLLFVDADQPVQFVGVDHESICASQVRG